MLTDEQWEKIAGLIPPARSGGRPRKTDTRAVLNAVIYWHQTGCGWRDLPPPPRFPPWGTVNYYWRLWSQSGIWDLICKTSGWVE